MNQVKDRAPLAGRASDLLVLLWAWSDWIKHRQQKERQLPQRKAFLLLPISGLLPGLNWNLSILQGSTPPTHPPPIPDFIPLVTWSIKKNPTNWVPTAKLPLIYLSAHALIHLFIYLPHLSVFISHAIPTETAPITEGHWAQWAGSASHRSWTHEVMGCWSV